MNNQIVPVNGSKMISNMMGEFEKALPQHIQVDKFARVILTEFRKNPTLLRCSEVSIKGALMSCAETGLMPGIIGDSCLVPFKNKGILECQFLMMYKGKLKLARNSAPYDFAADNVYENDQFEYVKGTDESIKHIPALKNKGGWLCVYAIAKPRAKEGRDTIVVLGKEEIDKVRAVAKTDMVWKPWFPEMTKKTAIHRLLKLLDMSTEDRRLLSLDETTRYGTGEYVGEDKTDWNPMSEKTEMYQGPPPEKNQKETDNSGLAKKLDQMQIDMLDYFGNKIDADKWIAGLMSSSNKAIKMLEHIKDENTYDYIESAFEKLRENN